MLFMIKTVVFTAIVVAVAVGVAHLSATSTSANPQRRRDSRRAGSRLRRVS